MTTTIITNTTTFTTTNTTVIDGVEEKVVVTFSNKVWPEYLSGATKVGNGVFEYDSFKSLSAIDIAEEWADISIRDKYNKKYYWTQAANVLGCSCKKLATMFNAAMNRTFIKPVGRTAFIAYEHRGGYWNYQMIADLIKVCPDMSSYPDNMKGFALFGSYAMFKHLFRHTPHVFNALSSNSVSRNDIIIKTMWRYRNVYIGRQISSDMFKLVSELPSTILKWGCRDKIAMITLMNHYYLTQEDLFSMCADTYPKLPLNQWDFERLAGCAQKKYNSEILDIPF